jgi:metallophosphoesterase (TIGR00282 family)
MRALLIGDVIGRPGRLALERFVIPLRTELGIDLVVVNCENAAGGLGVTPLVAEEMFRAGADVLTSGNHVWKKSEALSLLKLDHRVLRPANYPEAAPGSGAVVIETLSGQKVGIVNVQGRVFMEPTDCPFKAAQREVDRLRRETPMIIVDVHAEATSEKAALGWFLDGRVSCVFGTHTHIPTADERILPNGTAFLTDVGMTGPYDSVIGRKTEQILEKFLTGVPVKSEVAGGNVQLRALVVDVDPISGKALRVERLTKILTESVDGRGRD